MGGTSALWAKQIKSLTLEIETYNNFASTSLQFPSMRTFQSGCRPSSSLNSTACSFAYLEQCDYMSQLNYKLVNEVNDAETEKYYYKNRLNSQYRVHSAELEEAYTIINQKNNIILYMEESIDKLKKQFRVTQDDYVLLKDNSLAEKEYFEKEIQNMENKCAQKIRSIEQKLEKQYELKVNRRVEEVTRQCEDRIKMYQGQVQQLTNNSTQLTHELKLMQDQYRNMLLKNDLTIQESINRELRKRDYEAQNNYLRDVTQYQTLLKDKREIKQELANCEDRNKILSQKNKELQAQLQCERTKYRDIVETLEFEQGQRKQLEEKNYNLSSKFADTTEMDTNTEQAFVPVVMPVDLDLMSEIVGLKQFVVEKIIERFLDFFGKAANADPKKKSLSFTTFKNCMQSLKQTNPENKILLYVQSNLERVIKLYCPAMNYSKQYLTVKDEFIKRTLMECETITDPTQKLYRILELINRLKNPLTHAKSEISAGELRMVEIKCMAALKKVLVP